MSLSQNTQPASDRHCQGESSTQQDSSAVGKVQSSINTLAMTDRESHSDAGATQSIRDPTHAEDEDLTYVAGRIPSVQELEEVLHSATSSCHHGDEVWPNLFLGDMCVIHPVFK